MQPHHVQATNTKSVNIHFAQYVCLKRLRKSWKQKQNALFINNIPLNTILISVNAIEMIEHILLDCNKECKLVISYCRLGFAKKLQMDLI